MTGLGELASEVLNQMQAGDDSAIDRPWIHCRGLSMRPHAHNGALVACIATHTSHIYVERTWDALELFCMMAR